MTETRTVRAVIIPADESKAIEYRPVTADAKTFGSLVGGWLQMVALSGPRAALYCNEEGKLQRLPLNVRASRLAWAHGFTGHDTIVGDVFIVGVNGTNETDCPSEYEIFARYWEEKRELASEGNEAVLCTCGNPDKPGHCEQCDHNPAHGTDSNPVDTVNSLHLQGK